jgi:Ca2+-binding RTX toxin-like protein
VLDGGEDADIIRGGDGTGDTVTYANRTLPVAVTLDDKVGDGNGITDGPTENVDSKVENIIGGDGDDKLTGQTSAATANTLTGNGGIDTLDGSLGDDGLEGGDGADKLFSGPGDDALLAGNGDDTVKADTGNNTLRGENGDDWLDGDRGGDLIDGGLDADLVSYDRPVDGDIILEPEDITVTLDDALRNDGGVSDGLDPNQRDVVLSVAHVTTGDGNDTITGSANSETFDAGRGEDRLDGKEGDDTLIGGRDRDGLRGGLGNDKLYTGPLSGDDPSLDGIVDFLDDFPSSCGEAPARTAWTARRTWPTRTAGGSRSWMRSPRGSTNSTAARSSMRPRRSA